MFYDQATLKRQCPDAEVLHFDVTPYVQVFGQLSTPSDLSVFHYS